jgi:histidyl-tRNA synthetase
MLDCIGQVYERYGFEPMETPAIEYTESLGKFLPDQDRPNEGVFSFKDDDERWLSLRYDLTAPLARFVAEHFNALPYPYRSYRVGWVFRNEKPGPGRFRQFMQFDADTVGSASPAADAEICMMAADTMEALGLRGHYVVKLNNRKLLDGLMEVIGLSGEMNAARRLTALRALDKYDRVGKEGAYQLLTNGRRDESGDFTRGAGLSREQAQLLIWFLVLRSEPFGIASGALNDFNPQLKLIDGELNETYETDILRAMDNAYGSNLLFHEGIEELRAIESLLVSAGYADRVRIDPSIVRGLEYYTGAVFEVDFIFEIKDDRGKAVRFGSVGGGGRYDGLIARFRSQAVPATGFSIGVSRLLAALAHFGPIAIKPGPVVVMVLDRERIADYLQMVTALRNAGIRAELYLGRGRIKDQFKYADQRRAPCVVIQGSDEKAKRQVQIKDLIEGAKAAAAITSNQEWRESRPAQLAVDEEQLVDAVRHILNRQRAQSEAR